MKTVLKSSKLNNVLYDVRGPIVDAARQMEDEGQKIIKLNIGNMAPFGFDAPEEIQQDMIRNLPDSAGYSDSKGIFAARKAVMHYTQQQGIEGVTLDDIYLGNGASELIVMATQALLNDGDELLLPANVYGPSADMAANVLPRWGITHRFYDPADAAALDAMIGPQTRLLWLEAVGSVTMEFPDLRALVRVARARGVLTALDNTWGAGVAFNAFALGDGLGVDISAHALTKYPSGGGDVLMGAVTTRDEALHLTLKFAHMRMGWGVGANDVEAVLRGLPSLPTSTLSGLKSR